MAAKSFRVGIIGYGGSFNMGKTHLNAIAKNPEFIPAAICDLDKSRLVTAQDDFPGIETYTNVSTMLKKANLDLVIVITPHDSHAKLVIQCLKAKINVVCEKPLAITGAEVQAMLKQAKASKVMLSTFHNRRWDGDFVVLREILQEGWVGKVFRIEAGFSNYGEQRLWWRSDRKVSGGAIYDWGAHFTDWILNLVPNKIDYVTGFQVKNPQWKKYTNEDHSECNIHFKDGCTSTLTISFMSMEPKPRWRVLGDKGSVVDGGDHFVVNSLVNGRTVTTKVPFKQGNWDAYYSNVADHLVRGKKLVITAESAARVIGVLDAANKSAAKGGAAVKPIMA